MNLPAGEQGRVLIQTNRELEVNNLSFSCDIKIEGETGYNVKIIGPGDQPLVIDAAGAINLTGFSISNAGGIAINANRQIELSGNNFSDEVTINIGGVSGVTFPAGVAVESLLKLKKEGGDTHAGGSKIVSNVFGKDLKLNFSADVKTDAEYEASDNQGTGVDISGTGSLGAGAKMNIIRNAFNFIDVDMKVKATSEINVKQNTSLTDLGLNLSVGDTPTVNVDNNISSSVTIKADEFAQATFNLNLTLNKIQDAKFNFNVSDIKIKDLNNEWVQNTIILTAAALSPLVLMNYESVTSVYNGNFSITAYDESFLDNKFKVNATLNSMDLKGNFDATINGEANFEFDKNTKVKGYAKVKLKGNASDWVNLQDTGVQWEGGLEVDAREAAGVSASVKVTSQDGKFFKPLTLWVRPDVMVNLTVTNEIFEQLAGIHVIGKGEGAKKPLRNSKRPYAFMPAEGDEILISNVQWSSMGAGLNVAIAIWDVDVPVTIKDSTIQYEGWGIRLWKVNKPITIQNNILKGGGILVEYADDSVLIDDNQIEHTTENVGANEGIMVTNLKDANISNNTIVISHAGNSNDYGININTNSHVILTGNTITSSNIYGFSLTVGLDSIAYATSNSITGGSVALGDRGLIKLESNTFSSSGIIIYDQNIEGGLVNDPWGSNSGLDSHQIISPVDFDGDGCADYPYKPDPQKDNNGKCWKNGVSPPAEW